jgi:hypothetical protein
VPRESSIEQDAAVLLASRGFPSFKVGTQGWPDRQVMVGPGWHIWIEFKQPRGTLTKAQERRIPQLVKMGEVVLVAVSPAEALCHVLNWKKTAP